MLEFIILFSFILLLIGINLLLRNTNDRSRRYNRRIHGHRGPDNASAGGRGLYAFAALFCIATLCACGGGDNDNRNDSQPDTVTIITDTVGLNNHDQYEVYITQEDIDELREELPDSMGYIMTRNEFLGMRLFMMNCNKCHPGGEKGVGPSLNDKALPDFLIHFQIRQGLGDMPAFTKDELSKEEVQQIVRYVRFMRKNFVENETGS